MFNCLIFNIMSKMYARYRVKTTDLVPSKWPSVTEGGRYHILVNPLRVVLDLCEVALDTR